MIILMLTAFLAPDPCRNRMNEQATVNRTETALSIPATENRMNIRYEAGTARELTGAPNPYLNRMNDFWPKAPAPTVRPQPLPPPEPEVLP